MFAGRRGYVVCSGIGEDKMRFIPGLAILAFAAASPIAAQEQCSVGTLNGQYLFTGRGFIEAVEPNVQRVHFGLLKFDGAGKLSGKQSSSRGGKIGRETLDGSYTL